MQIFACNLHQVLLGFSQILCQNSLIVSISIDTLRCMQWVYLI